MSTATRNPVMSRRRLERAYNWQCTVKFDGCLIRCLMRAEPGRYYWHAAGTSWTEGCHSFYEHCFVGDLADGTAELLAGELPVDIAFKVRCWSPMCPVCEQPILETAEACTCGWKRPF